MKTILIILALILSIQLNAQNKPIYSMSKQHAVIYKPSSFEYIDSCKVRNKTQVSMYKNVLIKTKIVNQDRVNKKTPFEMDKNIVDESDTVKQLTIDSVRLQSHDPKSTKNEPQKRE